MRTISIVGVGLIGASFALALRKAGFSGSILGVSSAESIRRGMQAGAIERGVSLEEAAACSDLLYLSQPIETILNTLEALGPLARAGCLITDAGSTKVRIAEKARACLPVRSFLGGHPMAGKEQRGAGAADADLFRGRPYVLTGGTTDNPHAAQFREWLGAMGARVVEMTADEHDRTVALTSHLPQLLSTTLAAMLARQQADGLTEVFGPGLLDMTRLALSAPEIWMSVLKTNSEEVQGTLARFQEALSELQGQLKGGDVTGLFQDGRRFATLIRGFEKN